MTDHESDAIRDVHERDQNDAALHDITKQTARHYLMMRATQMSEASALILTRDFQNALMGSDLTFAFAEVDE